VFAQTGLRISRYHPHTEMSPHEHDEASMNIVVSGVFVERIGKDERTYTSSWKYIVVGWAFCGPNMDGFATASAH